MSGFHESGFKKLDFSQTGTFRVSPVVLKLNNIAGFNNAAEDGLGLCVMCILVTVLYLGLCDLVS